MRDRRSTGFDNSSNVCPVDDFAEAAVAGIAVPPGDVAADPAGLLGVAGVIGAFQGEVAQRGELRLDPVQPGSIRRHIGQLDVVGRSPLADPRVVTGRQVRAVVVQHQAEPHPGRVQGPQVAQEHQELPTALARLDVPVEPVAAQVVGGQQVPYAVRAGGGRPPAARSRPTAGAGGPVAAGVGLEVERAELVDADDDVGIADLDVDGAVHQAVQVQNPVLLGLEVRVARLLSGLQALKRHVLLTPSW
jgi:hypothetical protein